MLLFGEKPAKFLNEFSKEFHRDFMDILKRCHGTKRVFANAVYQGKGPSIHYVINFRGGGHGSYKRIIMHEKCGRPDSNGFQLK